MGCPDGIVPFSARRSGSRPRGRRSRFAEIRATSVGRAKTPGAMDSNRVPSSRTLPNARSFGFAAAGILHILRSQPNARFHLAATLAVVGLAVWTRVTRLEWLALVLASGLVWTAEALNTALEAVVDLASPQVHP